jgi:hypothetical protein
MISSFPEFGSANFLVLLEFRSDFRGDYGAEGGI